MKDNNTFYKSQYEFYSKTYWGTIHNNLTIPNGFEEYPFKIYDYFTKILNENVVSKKCEVLDICCGNGLLLKHLIEHCDCEIIPFGIDFQENSIQQAKSEIHSNFPDNFYTENAKNFNFKVKQFDVILIDPYHFTNIDFKSLVPKAIKNVKILTIFYCYADVLKYLNYKSILDFPILQSLMLSTYNYSELSIGINVAHEKKLRTT